ncbi:MAG: phosphoribosylformylglycinamidine cyclo-ligase [Clostridiales bacterium]|nr:phosphoribosylformylglycinamidine cyclo-ligase [Clostridiales bacterium]
MNDSNSESYKRAGVDVTAGYDAVRMMRPDVEKTFIKGVMGSIGGFGGLFEPDISNMKRPILVSGTDGVGTKLKIAFLMDKHDTVGIDCVAMCVNDIICSGATPMFFLDYIALGKLSPEKVKQIVKGVSDGCLQAGCALIGGETAEMPGFYPEDEYDLAGFSVGMADYDNLIDGSTIKPGDALIAIASSGVHSNGFSLVRKVLDVSENTIDRYEPELKKTVGEELLTPTRIYVNAIKTLRSAVKVKALSHITGGGFYENIPRMLKDGIRAQIEKKSLPRCPIFDLIMQRGNISEHDMYNTFNMGAGIVGIVSSEDASRAILALNAAGERAHIIGECAKGEKGVFLY